MSSGEKGDQPLLEELEVICWHKQCQTNEVKFLQLDNLYEKLHRPNMYDIGGTYLVDVRHFWFLFQTEQTSNHFVVHMFVCNCYETSFTLSISSSSHMTVDIKNKSVHLSKYLQEFQYPRTQPMNYSYITSYNFSDIDAEELKDRKVFIPIKITFDIDEKPASHEIMTNIKARHDFGSLLTDPIGSDCVMESTEGVKFQVHKLILAAQSKVFETMFKQGNNYKQGDTIKQDIDTEELRCFLEFIYTGSVKDIQNCDVLALMQLADKYEVYGLQDLCEHILYKQLGTDNALNILVWSDLYNAELLKAAALRCIKKHPSIIESSDFKHIRNVDLIQDVCRHMI